MELSDAAARRLSLPLLPALIPAVGGERGGEGKKVLEEAGDQRVEHF